MVELHNNAFKKETTPKNAVVAGTDNDAGFSAAATTPTVDWSGRLRSEPNGRVPD